MGDRMKRYRKWVGALHWGQMLLLIPTLLFAGVVAGFSAQLASEAYAADAVAVRYSAERALSSFESAERERIEMIDANLALPEKHEDDGFYKVAVKGGELVLALEDARTAEARAESQGGWISLAGLFGGALMWLTAFLSLWWWFGAQAKPKGAQ
jgi:hypothetical protein